MSTRTSLQCDRCDHKDFVHGTAGCSDCDCKRTWVELVPRIPVDPPPPFRSCSVCTDAIPTGVRFWLCGDCSKEMCNHCWIDHAELGECAPQFLDAEDEEEKLQ